MICKMAMVNIFGMTIKCSLKYSKTFIKVHGKTEKDQDLGPFFIPMD